MIALAQPDETEQVVDALLRAGAVRALPTLIGS